MTDAAYEPALERGEATALASKISHQVSLLDLRVGHISADLIRKPQTGPLTIDPTSDITWDELDGALLFHVNFRLEVTEPGDADDAEPVPLFNAEARLDVDYAFEGEAPEDGQAFAAFAQLSVMHTAYPYLRELVHTLTVRAGLPPLVLPSFLSPALRPAGSDPEAG